MFSDELREASAIIHIDLYSVETETVYMNTVNFLAEHISLHVQTDRFCPGRQFLLNIS